jgi:hypothetical protein
MIVQDPAQATAESSNVALPLPASQQLLTAKEEVDTLLEVVFDTSSRMDKHEVDS